MRVQACKSGLWAVGLLMMGVVMANENELLDAVRDGELGRVQQLITAGVDLQAATEDGSSALLLAGSVRFFVCGPVTACRKASPSFTSSTW